MSLEQCVILIRGLTIFFIFFPLTLCGKYSFSTNEMQNSHFSLTEQAVQFRANLSLHDTKNYLNLIKHQFYFYYL